jgi:hypothetical protein
MKLIAFSVLAVIIAEAILVGRAVCMPFNVYEDGRHGATLELHHPDASGVPYLLCTPTTDEAVTRIRSYAPYPLLAVACIGAALGISLRNRRSA